MAAPAGNPAGSAPEQSRAQKSDCRHRAADGGGPVALADRQGQSPRSGLGDGRRQWLSQRNRNLNEGKGREFETARARTRTWVGNDSIWRLGALVSWP